MESNKWIPSLSLDSFWQPHQNVCLAAIRRRRSRWALSCSCCLSMCGRCRPGKTSGGGGGGGRGPKAAQFPHQIGLLATQRHFCAPKLSESPSALLLATRGISTRSNDDVSPQSAASFSSIAAQTPAARSCAGLSMGVWRSPAASLWTDLRFSADTNRRAVV